MNSRAAFLFASCLFAACPSFASQDARIVLPTGVAPVHYDVEVMPDAARLRFAGTEHISIEVRAPVSDITLNAADLTFDKVEIDGAGEQPQVRLDANHETATFRFPRPISAGRHVLTIHYRGKINQHAAGLFALDYKSANGRKRALYTQFENSDARRFIPCWDEPALKATFTLIATVPVDEMAVSNMPIASSEPIKGGFKRVTFRTSPKMSTYLLFFALGDFERISRIVDGVDVGVVATRGNKGRSAFALDAAVHLLPYYNRYFDVKYPLPKLDLVAGPGESQFFGAMENWGAIFYFDRDLLIDPALSTEDDKRRVYIVVAHEMAHQWFGDLVTMAWWDDLWLNEGFASWMEFKATDRFHPEWRLWLQSQQAKERAMAVDARRGTHPIITSIHDVLQANEAFDTITYSKGQSVIRMLEDYVGDDAFRAGVRRYIKAHAYANSVTDDLWRALDAVQPVPVTKIAHDFTLQAGIPLIRVTPKGTGISLAQDTYSADDSGNSSERWMVPVIVTQGPGGAPRHGLVERGQTVEIPVQSGPVIVNAGQAGYYRTLYAPPLEDALILDAAHLHDTDQMGLMADAQALGYAGYAPLGSFMALARAMPQGADPMVLADLASRLGDLGWIYRGLPGQAAYQRYARNLVKPVFDKVGWTAKPGEGANMPLLRRTLLESLSKLDDNTVIADARARFAEYVKNPASFSPELRHSVLEIVAAHPTAQTWDAMHELAMRAPSAIEQSELYRNLGRGDDRVLAEKALQLTLTNELPVTMRPSVISAAAAGYFPDMAFDFAVAHFDVVNSWLEPDSRNEYEARLAGESYDPAMTGKLQRYADSHVPAGAGREVTMAEAKIAYSIMVRTKRLPEADAWLRAQAR